MIQIRVWGPVLKRDYYVVKCYNGKIEKIRNIDKVTTEQILEGEFRLIREETITRNSPITMCKVDPESYIGDPKGTLKVALHSIVSEDFYIQENDEFHADIRPIVEDFVVVNEKGLSECIKCMNDIKSFKEFLENTEIITRGNKNE